MAFPTRTQVPVAVNSRSKHDLSAPHVTTSNFMELSVAKCMEMVPGQNLKIDHKTFSRLEPLALPTFGNAEIRNKVFFVPFRTIWPAWQAFIDDVPHVFNDGEVIPTSVPYIPNKQFYEFLMSSECSTVTTNDIYSFLAHTGDSTTETRNFTTFGRYVYKILRSLGYSPCMDINYIGGSSALPLLALAKVYLDWFYPSQYSSSSEYLYVSKLLQNNDIPVTTSSFLTNEDMLMIFTLFKNICYDPDYFTSAWDNPTGPNSGLSSSFSISDANFIQTSAVTGSVKNDIVETNALYDNTTYIAGVSTSSPYITQYLLDTLRAMTDYSKRNQLAGSRDLDRYFARYGVKLSAEKLKRSVLISEYRQVIDFGDVTSTASTETANLGDFAGKGVSYGNGQFTVDSNGEFGMMLIITTIIPKTYYYQGIDRCTLHLTKRDFFTPELDAQGVQAISQAEYYAPLSYEANSYATTSLDGVYGFTSKYAEYKIPRALISGDYVDDAINTGKDAWTLFRNVKESQGYIHSFTNILSTDRDQYNRIFQYTGNDVDHFNIIHHFDITSSFPGKSLFDTYEFRDEDKSDKVTIDVNGTTVS